MSTTTTPSLFLAVVQSVNPSDTTTAPSTVAVRAHDSEGRDCTAFEESVVTLITNAHTHGKTFTAKESFETWLRSQVPSVLPSDLSGHSLDIEVANYRPSDVVLDQGKVGVVMRDVSKALVEQARRRMERA